MQGWKQSCKNISASLPLHILQVVANFVVRTIFIQQLSDGYLGVDGVLGNVLTLMSVSEFGLNTSVTYALYGPLERHERVRAASIVQYAARLFHRITRWILVAAVLAIPLLSGVIQTDAGVSFQALTVFYLLKVSTVSITYMAAAHAALISADEKDYVVRSVYALTNLTRAGLQILVLFLFQSYLLYLLCDVVLNLLCSLILVMKARRDYPEICQPASVSEADRTSLFVNTGSVFCYKLSGLLLTATDTLLISTLVSTVAAGFYSLYSTLQTSLLGILNNFFTGIVHTVGHLNVSSSAEEKQSAFWLLHEIMYVLALFVTVCFCVLANDFVALWGGPEKVLGTGVVLAVGISVYMTIVFYPVDMFRQTTSMFHKTKGMALFCALLNLVLSVLFSLWLGLLGVLVATPISRWLTTFWYEPFVLLRQYLHTSSLPYFAQISTEVVMLTGLWAVCDLLTRSIDASGMLGFAFKTICTAALAGTGCGLWVFSSSRRRTLFAALLQKFGLPLK